MKVLTIAYASILSTEKFPSATWCSPEVRWPPQYTRPADFRGWEVPEVLRGGDHAKVDRWRRAQALRRTVAQRPDLIEARGGLTDDEKHLLEGTESVSYPSPFPS